MRGVKRCQESTGRMKKHRYSNEFKVTIPDPSPDFKWINIWAAADPVSGRLDFYDVAGPGVPRPDANQFERPYPWYSWGYAHIMYWSDRELYSLIAQNLL